MLAFLQALGAALLIVEGFISLTIGGAYFIEPYLCLTEGVATHGIVAATQPVRNHQSVHYSYSVDGRTFEGLGNGGWGNPDNAALHPGDAVLLYYAASHPQVSCLGTPDRGLSEMASNLGFVAIVTLGFYFSLFRPAARAGISWWLYPLYQQLREEPRRSKRDE